MESKETEELRAAYRELEREARSYADPAAAVTTARRRRTRMTATAAAAAVAVIVVGAGVGWDRGTSPTTETAAQMAPSGSARPSAPLNISPPANASPLPGGGTGVSGLLLYTSCMHGCPTFVVLTDGRQYRLDGQTAPPPGNLTLSPDGRWLGMPTATGYELRDLVEGTVHRIAAPQKSRPNAVYSPWVWSADGRFLVLGHHASGDVRAYVQVEPATGRTTTPKIPDGYEPLGVLPSGDALLFDRSAHGKTSSRVDLALGVPGRFLTLDAGSTSLVTADGGPTIQVRGDRIYAVAPDLTTVIVFDLNGKELSRIPLSQGEGPLVPVEEGYAVQSGPVLEVRAAASGRKLHDVPKEAQIVLPGQAR